MFIAPAPDYNPRETDVSGYMRWPFHRQTIVVFNMFYYQFKSSYWERNECLNAKICIYLV